MAQKMEVYKCSICGNIVEILAGGAGSLVCCGQPMAKMTENTTDAAVEKHVPVLQKQDGFWQVNVGSVDHPMTAEHYIEWIELVDGDMVYRQNLKPGDKPSARFACSAAKVEVRAYCNLHGLWKA